jgi:hypothetical protein
MPVRFAGCTVKANSSGRSKNSRERLSPHNPLGRRSTMCGREFGCREEGIGCYQEKDQKDRGSTKAIIEG